MKFLDNIHSFNLVEVLKKTINNYNRIKHSVIKYSPIEVFYSSNNSLFEKVYNNTLEYYLNHQKNNIVYENGEKCLMKNNIIITKKKYNKKYYIIEKNKIKNNKSFIKLIVEIKKNLGSSSYLVEILQIDKIYKLKKINIMLLILIFLKKCDNNIVGKILSYNQDNNLDIITDNKDNKINISASESDDLMILKMKLILIIMK